MSNEITVSLTTLHKLATRETHGGNSQFLQNRSVSGKMENELIYYANVHIHRRDFCHKLPA